MVCMSVYCVLFFYAFYIFNSTLTLNYTKLFKRFSRINRWVILAISPLNYQDLLDYIQP